jgi:mannose-6-phosphate isomerase
MLAKNVATTVTLIHLEGGKRHYLQFHYNRAEYWKVIKGPIKVKLEDEERLLQTNESILIPKRAVHNLMGAGTNVITLETSIGKFDEGDIVRLQDDYGRKLLRDPNSLCDRL